MDAWWLLIAGLTAVGAALLVTGLVRRVGEERRCRRCGYEVAGLSGQCPECAAPLAGRGVVRGRRRRGSMASGSLLLIVSSGLVATDILGLGASIRLYPSLPDWLIVSLAQSGNLRAEEELRARYLSGDLAEEQSHAVVDLALERITTSPDPWRDASLDPWVDFAHAEVEKGVLSSFEKDRLFNALLDVKVEVRPRIEVGCDLPCRFIVRGRPGQRHGFTLTWRCSELRVGDVTGPGAGGSGGFVQGPTEPHAFPLPDDLDLGRHTASATFDLWIGGASGPSSLWQGTVEAEASFEVVPEGHGVTTVDDPELGERIARSMRATGAVEPPYVPGRGPALEVRVEVDEALPCDIAFDASLHVGGVEHACVGSITLPRGAVSNPAEDGFRLRTECPVVATPGEPIELVLRPSRAAAESTVDVSRIWSGELVIPVEMRP